VDPPQEEPVHNNELEDNELEKQKQWIDNTLLPYLIQLWEKNRTEAVWLAFMDNSRRGCRGDPISNERNRKARPTRTVREVGLCIQAFQIDYFC
jgi:hypothetical protein